MADRRKKLSVASRADTFARRYAPVSVPLAQRAQFIDWMRFAFLRGYDAARRDGKGSP